MPFSEINLKKDSFLFGCFIILFTIAVYLPSLKIPFVNDEIYFIQRNEVSNPQQLFTLLEKKDYDGYYYRPLPNLVSGITTLVFGYKPALYRAFNILLHASAALLVYLLIFSLLKGIPNGKLIAFFTALFFSSFPLHDYSVIWHTDLFDRIMIITYLSGLIIFVRNNYKNSSLSILCFLLSLLSKEMAFSFPILIGLIYFFFGEKQFDIKKSILKSAPYILTAAIFIIFRIILFHNNVFTAKDAHSVGHLPDILRNYVLFSGLLIFPFFLREMQHFISVHKLIALAAAAAVFVPAIFAFLKYRRKDYLIYFFLAFYIFSLAPASRLFMRWYLYLPSVGFLALLTYLLISSLPHKYNLHLITVILILIIYTGSLFAKELIWVKNTNETVNMLSDFIKTERNEIIKNNEAVFLTLPAKVDDIPIFQLGFDYLFNYYLGGPHKVNVNVLTTSYLSSARDSVYFTADSGQISINQSDDNYFILFNNEKNIKFEPKNFHKNKLKSLSLKFSEVKNKVLYTFSKGKFYKFKGLK